jgi:RNA polymerase sigma-70 factor (ECF subfamily)
LLSDAQLVVRVRLGDVDLFGQLAQRYERSLLAIALAELRNFHEAEDVVQTTLLLAFRQLKTLRDERKFGPWLIQIARCQVVETANARQIPVTISLNESRNRTADDTNNDAWIESEHLLGLVARLPDHERLLVGLRYFDGHNMTDIAAITGRPLGTVTKQLSRAASRLRSWYDEEDLR